MGDTRIRLPDSPLLQGSPPQMLSCSTVPFPKPSLAQPQKKRSWLGFHRRLQRTTSAALDHILKSLLSQLRYSFLTSSTKATKKWRAAIPSKITLKLRSLGLFKRRSFCMKASGKTVSQIMKPVSKSKAIKKGTGERETPRRGLGAGPGKRGAAREKPV